MTPKLEHGPRPQAPAAPGGPAMVELENVEVEFDGFKALNIRHFSVAPNELRVVIGPNGAGKTTLCDVISGKTRPKKGRVRFDGTDITRMCDTQVARRGVGRKFQTPTVFDSLTVYENMELAAPGRRNVLGSLFRGQPMNQQSQITDILRRVHLLEHQHRRTRFLSHGQRQWLEISMLIVAEPKLLLVDEPAAGLTDDETRLTADLLLELRGKHTIIVIEHDMEFVRRLNSRITVLNEGQMLAEGSIDEIQTNKDVIEAYLGR